MYTDLSSDVSRPIQVSLVESGAGAVGDVGHHVEIRADGNCIDKGVTTHCCSHLVANRGQSRGVALPHGFSESGEKLAVTHATVTFAGADNYVE